LLERVREQNAHVIPSGIPYLLVEINKDTNCCRVSLPYISTVQQPLIERIGDLEAILRIKVI
jgi:hypothetical protein